MEAAARLFRDKGFKATSVRDIAKAVDLKASSLYNHINSKDQILAEICFTNARRFLQGMEEVKRASEKPEARLVGLIRLHIEVAVSDLTSVTAFNDEWRYLPEPKLSAFLDMRRSYEQQFLEIIEKGIQKGVIRPIEPVVALYTIISSLRWLYDWYLPGKRIRVEDLEASICTLLFEGLSNN